MSQAKIINKKIKATNRHWKNFIDKDYLGSHNLEEGEEMLLTVEKFVGDEEVTTADGKKTKQVIYFKENVPKMILNITNGNTLSSLYGPHPDNWVGKQIQLHAASVKAFGKTQDALRIRPFVPKRDIDAAAYTSKLVVAKNIEELQKIWVTFPASAREDSTLKAKKDELKTKLSA